MDSNKFSEKKKKLWINLTWYIDLRFASEFRNNDKNKDKNLKVIYKKDKK